MHIYVSYFLYTNKTLLKKTIYKTVNNNLIQILLIILYIPRMSVNSV